MFTRSSFAQFICDKLDEIKALFERKNSAYGSESDAFWNFRQTAIRKFGSALPPAMFDVAYILADKHWVALGKGIDVPEAEERLQDMIVYCLIMMAMSKEYRQIGDVEDD